MNKFFGYFGKQSRILIAVGLAAGFGLATARVVFGDEPGEPLCPAVLCSIETVHCNMGDAPAQSEQCQEGQRCKKKANSCWGLPPFQIPIYGYVECIDCVEPPPLQS